MTFLTLSSHEQLTTLSNCNAPNPPFPFGCPGIEGSLRGKKDFESSPTLRSPSRRGGVPYRKTAGGIHVQELQSFRTDSARCEQEGESTTKGEGEGVDLFAEFE